MKITFGEAETDRRLGYVAARCDNCDGIVKMEVRRRGMSIHILGIALGSGTFLSAYGRCTTCKAVVPLEPTDFPVIRKAGSEPLSELIAATNPQLADESGQAWREFERFAAIRAPFLDTDELFVGGTHKLVKFDRTSVLGFVTALALPILVGYLSSFLPLSDSTRSTVFLSLIALFFVGVMLAFVIYFRYPTRVIRRLTLPRIVGVLRPLTPASAEIDMVLKRLRQYDHRICDYVSTQGLMKALTQG